MRRGSGDATIGARRVIRLILPITPTCMLCSPVMNGLDNIAVILNRDGRDTSGMLADIAEAWRERGIGVVGVVAENDTDTTRTCSAGFLRDIATGRRYSVRLDTVPAETSCHLDAAGMASACEELLGQIEAADVVILSKFGKLEAMRQGLWPAFAAAFGSGKPVVTTVSAKHADAWKAVAPAAIWLDDDTGSVDRWWLKVRPEDTPSGND